MAEHSAPRPESIEVMTGPMTVRDCIAMLGRQATSLEDERRQNMRQLHSGADDIGVTGRAFEAKLEEGMVIIAELMAKIATLKEELKPLDQQFEVLGEELLVIQGDMQERHQSLVTNDQRLAELAQEGEMIIERLRELDTIIADLQRKQAQEEAFEQNPSITKADVLYLQEIGHLPSHATAAKIIAAQNEYRQRLKRQEVIDDEERPRLVAENEAHMKAINELIERRWRPLNERLEGVRAEISRRRITIALLKNTFIRKMQGHAVETVGLSKEHAADVVGQWGEQLSELAESA